MKRRNFRRDQFRNEPSRNNQITCYGCKQPGHLRSEYPLNKEGKKDKDKKKMKAMVVTWFDNNPFSSESEPKIEIKANLCLMAIEDEVCIDDFDDFDKLQNEYEYLFNDFEKLRHRCKDYKKIITTITLDVEKAKHDYDVVINNKNELKKYFDNLKPKIEAHRLELEEKEKHTNHKYANRSPRKKHAHITCYECGRKGHIALYYSYNAKHFSLKEIWVPKGSHILTNTQGPTRCG